MKCFYHHEIDAVAICKSCHRALCDSCAIDVHPGTACANRCEKDVEDLNVIIERSKSALQKTGKAYIRNAVAMLLAGLVFLFVGIFPVIQKGNYHLSFVAILGLISLLWSYFSYRSGKQIQSTDENA